MEIDHRFTEFLCLGCGVKVSIVDAKYEVYSFWLSKEEVKEGLTDVE